MKLLIVTLLFTLLVACSEKPLPPVASIIPDTTYIHGDTLIDNYAWLKDKTREKLQVLEYVHAENEYTHDILRHTEKMQKSLFQELKNRIKDDDMGVPTKKGRYYYYYRREQNKQYPIYCRKMGNMQAVEEVYLDVNELAKGYKFFSIIGRKVSPSHQFIAYGVDTTGSEDYTLVVKDIFANRILVDSVAKIGGIVWANDNKTIFYSTEDQAGRTHKIYRHVLGSDIAMDELIFTEKDERFWVWLTKTRNKKYIILGTASKTTTEYRFLKTDNPQGEFKLIEPRNEGHRYYVLSHKDSFYIISNSNAINNKLMITLMQKPSKENWQEVITTRSDVLLNAEVSQNHLILTERKNGLEKLRIINLKSGAEHYVDFPEPIYTFYTWNSSEYESSILRITYESLVSPYMIYDYNMDTKEKVIMKQQEIQGDFNSENYISERLFATATDGTEIPISIVYNRNFYNGNNPFFLTAYGAYGDNSDTFFSSYRLSLLDRGITYGIAHVRGGKEMGQKWYDEGKMLNKKNTFTDFIACAEFLKDENIAGKLIINGGSAGGLLIGAVCNMRPELFFGAIADVPFVDVLNTMMDPTLSAVVSEYEEWGNPNIKDQYEYILSYSPYENISKQDYPHILALAGFYDTRVNYWEPAKWIAKLREYKTNDNLLLLETNLSAGHAGASGRYDYLKEIALTYAFVFKILGIEE